MGVDYSIHVGPYVECKTTKVDYPEGKWTCPNKKCINHNCRESESNKFCSECGTQLKEVVTHKKVASVNNYEVQDKIKEKLCRMLGDEAATYMEKNNVQLWVANVNYLKRKESFDPRHEEFFVNSIQPSTIVDEIEKFKEKFAKELAYFEEVYGSGNVTVLWGIANVAY